MADPTKTTDARPRILYADTSPSPPFPLRMEGSVISGFGRGSKELGIPTANLPVDSSSSSSSPSSSSASAPWLATARSGVYFGWASLSLPPEHPDSTTTTTTATATDNDLAPSSSSSSSFQIYPMVMSIGYNPFYKNTVRSAEVHVLHAFGADFYGAPMRLLVLGFVRDELDYAGLEALVTDIRIDCDVARQSLARDAWTPAEGVVGGRRGTLDGSWLVR
ncbi:putative riboflavin kinase [Rosellinia necatrix]|uniref:Riboflavin kinase n=1 Tax=Rosellinia necatrix TaxID=77044 RepID=A0A1W2TG68_ROSNE|nr:putative riboflavin kinase [Rosellinia necatrix]